MMSDTQKQSNAEMIEIDIDMGENELSPDVIKARIEQQRQRFNNASRSTKLADVLGEETSTPRPQSPEAKALEEVLEEEGEDSFEKRYGLSPDLLAATHQPKVPEKAVHRSVLPIEVPQNETIKQVLEDSSSNNLLEDGADVTNSQVINEATTNKKADKSPAPTNGVTQKSTTPKPASNPDEVASIDIDLNLNRLPIPDPKPKKAAQSRTEMPKKSPAYVNTTLADKPTKIKKDTVLSKKSLSVKQVGAVMAVSLALITWLKQDRLADYWQQSYQSSQPWATLASIGLWQSGEKVGHALSVEMVNAGLSGAGEGTKNWLNKVFFANELAKQKVEQELKAEQEKQAKLAQAQAEVEPQAQPNPTMQPVKSSEPKTHIMLSAGQKVLFAGDSMMQGVAPWVMRKLKSDYQIDSMDLSKQSTGLSYSSFFDWPATIEKTLKDQPNIGALVIYLGANDPWAVPNPANKAAKYIDFATDEWVVLYHQKMNRILDNAKSHGVQVIWITPPTMKKPKLNEQMKILTEIMHKGIDKTEVVVIDSKPLMSPTDAYTDSITIGEKTVKVRTADGIHFTTDGQKHLANHILMHIQVNP